MILVCNGEVLPVLIFNLDNVRKHQKSKIRNKREKEKQRDGERGRETERKRKIPAKETGSLIQRHN
jgi:hypothetical protein